jgi:hypothetical protein
MDETRLTCAWCGKVTAYILSDVCSRCYLILPKLRFLRDQMEKGRLSEWGDGAPYDPNREEKGEAWAMVALELYPYYRHIVVERRAARDYIRPKRDDEGEEMTAA